MRVSSTRKIKSHEQQTKSTNYYEVQVIFYINIWNSHNLNFTVLHLIQNNVVTYIHGTKSIRFYSIFSSNTQQKWWDNQIEISTVNLFASIQYHIKYHLSPPKTRNWMHIDIYLTMHTICNSAITKWVYQGHDKLYTNKNFTWIPAE